MLKKKIYCIYMADQRKIPRPAVINGDVAYIPLGVNAKDGFALVDVDMAWVADQYKFTLDGGKRYAVTGTYVGSDGKQRLAYLHRLVMGIDANGIVDHISRDRLDNRRCNLRLVDNRINQLNTGYRGGKSRHRGVSWDKKASRWRAKLKNNGITINLGNYSSEDDAAAAYNAGAVEHFGEHAQLNDILDKE